MQLGLCGSPVYTGARGVSAWTRGGNYLHKTIMPLTAKGYGQISALDVFKEGVPKQK